MSRTTILALAMLAMPADARERGVRPEALHADGWSDSITQEIVRHRLRRHAPGRRRRGNRMTELQRSGAASRRALLNAVAAGTLGAGAASAAEGNPANLPPNTPEWAKSLGPGVIDEAYGTRSRHEHGGAPLRALADAGPAILHLLHAAGGDARHHHPLRPAL